MAAFTTDIRTLLAAVRRGDFTALLAAVDHWTETPGCEKQLEAWEDLVRRCRWNVRHRDRVAMGVLEATARWVRRFVWEINRLEGRPWRLPKGSYTYVGTYAKIEPWMGPNTKNRVRVWDWCKDLADALLKHVKAHPEAA